MIMAVREEIDGPIPAESVGLGHNDQKMAKEKNTDGSKLGELEINSLVVTVYLKDPYQTFNATIEILQQKDGAAGCDITPKILE